MFKCVNAVSGSLSDLKEAHKKKLNVTLAHHAVRILLSILVCSGWSVVPVGRCIVLLSLFLRRLQRGRDQASWWLFSPVIHRVVEWVIYAGKWQLSAAESPWGWSHLFTRGVILHVASSVWPCVRKRPRLPAWDLVDLGVLVAFRRGRVPRGTGIKGHSALLPSTCISWTELGGCLLVVPWDGDSRSPEPWPVVQLPKRLAGWLQKCWSFLCKR